MTGPQKPSVGRIVHFVLANGEHRMAEVTYVAPGSHDGRCDLTVKLALGRDLQADGSVKVELAGSGAVTSVPGVLGFTDVPHDELEQASGSWHWPERT